MESQSLYQDVPPAAPVEKASVIEDFVDIFYAPSKVFDRRRDGNFGAALALLVLIVLVLYFATRAAMEPVYDATMEQQIRLALAKNPNMPPAALNTMRSMGGAMMGFGIIIGAPIALLAAALTLFFVARLVDLRPTFSQSAMIVTLANVPRFVVGTVASAVQAFAFVTPDNPRTIYQLALSPARVLPADAHPALVGSLMRFDLTLIWATVLIGIGVAVVCRVDRKRGFVAALLTWFVAGLVQVALASAGK